MTLNGKQPLATLTLTLSLVNMKRLGIDLTDLSSKLQEAVQPFLTTIHPYITIVNMAASAAYANSFIPISGEPKGADDIEAIFQAYEKIPLTNKVMQKKDEEARIGVEMARGYFQDNPLQVVAPEETTKNILCGMKFQATNINYVTNTVTFELVE